MPRIRLLRRRGDSGEQRGQVLPLFVLMIFVITGMVATVVDVSWLWSNSLRIQRAADAAALAGAPYLPGNVAGAYAAARAEATKNGYTDGVDGVVITPRQDPRNTRRLIVRVETPVEMFFARALGISSTQVGQTARAEFALPVPMGSPLNYLGVFTMRTPANPDPGDPVISSDGVTPLDSQGLWLGLVSQGADKINGDAYLAKYNPQYWNLNAEYAPDDYYDYAVEMPAGSSGGSVWVFDAPFCATHWSAAFGTGDRWLRGDTAMSTFYDLYDTMNTPYDKTDDVLVADSDNLFRRVRASDTDLGGPPASNGIKECKAGSENDPRKAEYWHNRWWPIATGLPGGRTYRLHVDTTDPVSANDQNNTDAHNEFAIEARATGGTPRVYGLGSMEAFSPVRGGGASVFYLAQIDDVHAGKTMEIELWDPGDTIALGGSLQILEPTATGYQAATFSYTAQRLSLNAAASACDSRAGTNVTSLTTNTGGFSLFNGCWVRMTIPLSGSYSAPTPPGEPEPGWWKIRYNMTGSASDAATDMTTWKVSLRGSPVHLVP